MRAVTANGDGLALPVGNIGQCDGAVRAGISDASCLVCEGSVEDIAQRWTP